MNSQQVENNDYINDSMSLEKAFELRNYQAAAAEMFNYFSDNKHKKELVLAIFFNEKLSEEDKMLKFENLYYPTLELTQNIHKTSLKVSGLLI